MPKRKRTLPSINEVTQTCNCDEPDMLTFDCSEPVRLKMSCGHVIGPQSLYDYCSSELKRGEYTFVCPHVNSSGWSDCSQTWDYDVVRQVACLTDSQKQDFELRLSDNYLQRTAGMQKCGGCLCWCCRIETDKNCVRCLLCSAEKGRAYDFCWVCLKEWRNSDPNGQCGNKECPEIKRRILARLANCPMKNIDGVLCPTLRACPRCSTLLEHTDQCKHVRCTACCYNFCFVCLKMENPDDAGYLLPNACTAPWGCKNVAPRQTDLN